MRKQNTAHRSAAQISLRPSNATQGDDDEVQLLLESTKPPQPHDLERPTLADIKAFASTIDRTPPEERDQDRHNIKLWSVLDAAIESLESAATTNRTDVGLWVVHRGLQRLLSLPDVIKSIAAAKMLVRAGVDIPDCLYRARHGEDRLYLRHVTKKQHHHFTELRRGLRVPRATVGPLVLMAGLVDAPLDDSHRPEQIRRELEDFQRKLHVHAASLWALAESLPQELPSPNRLTWSDVVKG